MGLRTQSHLIISDEVTVQILEQNTAYKQARAECYKLLAACFYQPDKELFLEEKVFENLALLLNKTCPEAAVFSDRMCREIMNYSNEDLLVEYSRLFVGPYELLAAPYGSIYLDGAKMMVMGDSTMEVLSIYKGAGLSIDDNFGELPDHIAVELEFMYYLSAKEREALSRYESANAEILRTEQDAFISRFLGQWVPAFCEKIKEGTENSFYLLLADCLSAFIAREVGNVTVPEVSRHSKCLLKK